MAFTVNMYVKALMWYNNTDRETASREFLLYKSMGGKNISDLNDITKAYRQINS